MPSVPARPLFSRVRLSSAESTNLETQDSVLPQSTATLHRPLHHSACIEQDVLSVGLKDPVMFSLGILCVQRPQIKSPSPRRTRRRRKPLSTLAAHNTARMFSAYQSQLVLLDHHHPIVRLPRAPACFLIRSHWPLRIALAQLLLRLRPI